MLRINYLCGRITNSSARHVSLVRVVICSELTTFAVESPTLRYISSYRMRCDLLRINYLCGRITNENGPELVIGRVVICSELTTFAVESPTNASNLVEVKSCDLLRINYLCGRITNIECAFTCK